MVVNIHHIQSILYPKQVLECKGFVSEGDLYNQRQGRSKAVFRRWGGQSRQRAHKRLHYLQKIANVIFRTLFTSIPTSFGQQFRTLLKYR